MANLSSDDYDRSKLIIDTDRNYHISFQDVSGQPVNLTPIGDPDFNSSGSPQDIITIQRYAVLKRDAYSKIIQVVVRTWD